MVQDLIPKLTLFLVTLTTLATSAVAAKKIITEVPSLTPTNQLVLGNNTTEGTADNPPTIAPSITSTPTSPLPTSQKLTSNTSPVTLILTPTIKSNQTSSGSQKNSACLITLFEQQYDVTSLRASHSGGDVFQCGTDMTTVYQSRHGTNVTRIQPYLYTGSNPTNIPTPRPTSTLVPTPTVYPQPETEDEEENEEEERRYLPGQPESDDDDDHYSYGDFQGDD